MRVILDATAITAFRRCPEEFRQTYLCNRASAFVAIHREAGIAIHKGVEALWQQREFTEALAIQSKYMQQVPEERVHANDKRKWEELKAMAPTMLATYADSVDTSKDRLQQPPAPLPPCPMLEFEWKYPGAFGIEELTLCGRIDRVEVGPVLVDTKTATEIDGYDEFNKKVGWERSYRASMVKEIGIGLYDWYLRQVGLAPAMTALECILKPSERYGRKCRVVRLELPEVLAYRERFDMLLEHTCKEIFHYVKSYSQMAPWPMNGSACSGKFDNCHLLAACNLGINPRTEKLYREREEHLSISGKRIEL